MALAAGTTVGPYEIVGFIGAGGMGEVYRARDARLGRDVAIKTLPASLSGDVERLRRFEVEARAASQLSHPNILTVYDIGSADGRPYIVSELLEGETLRERLSRGPIALKKSAEIAIALADALAAAHGRGIVHRDLKPENLLVTREGRLKILDFGIAKLTTPDPIKGVAASTVHLLTEVGSTVGTPGYMAPEQVRGDPVDHRSDIFALGAILHEMLSGVAVFQRDSRIATLSAVLESNPPDLPDTVAPAVRRIVQRCLEKSPDERFQSARDLAFALNALSDVSVATTGATRLAVGPRRVDWRIAALGAGLAAAVAAGTLLTFWPRPTATPQPLKQFVIQPSTLFSDVAVSPDGSLLAYVMADANVNHIFLRPFARLEPQRLEGSQGAAGPVFSHDGRWVAFAAGGKLKKLPITGGTPVTLCDAPEYLSASWSNSGHIVIAQRKSGLMRVSAEGGAPELVTTVDVAAGEIDHHSPQFLPGDKALLFGIHAGPEVFRIAVRSLATGEQKTLVDDGFDARYLPSGHLVYARGETLYAAPFDVSRLEISGPEVAILDRVETEPYNGFAAIAVADDGTLAYLPAVDREHRSLVWVKRDGTSDPLPAPERAYDSPSLSPDGTRLALQIAAGPNKNVFVYEFGAGTLTRQTQGGIESKPIWTSDGKSLAYASGRGAERSLLMQPLDGSAPPRKLYQTRQDVWPGSWTPDGQSLVFVETPPTEFGDIKIVSATADAKAEPLVASENPEFSPALSPDGRWLAYMAIDGVRAEVYVRPFRGGTSRQISTDGGREPRWSRDGRELFYRRGRFMVAVPVRATPELTFGKPETLFDGVYVNARLSPPAYDVTADGRFIMIKRSRDELAVRPINVVLNWFDELNRRAPARR